MTEGDWARGIDTEKPSPARMYDYFLGGSHNFASDRAAAEQVIAAIPNVRVIAQTNRAFLGQVVRYLVDQGVRQFLDIGSGIPTVGNVHEILASRGIAGRVVYVDIDPVAVAHSTNLLQGHPHATAILADLRNPKRILGNEQLRAVLDLSQPIGLLYISVLQFVGDDEAYPAVATLRESLASGSYLAITHIAAEGFTRNQYDTVGDVYKRSTTPTGVLRTKQQITTFFDGYDLLEPGVVWVSQWSPGALADSGPNPEQIGMLAGVARKP